MRLLAIETATDACSVAIINNDVVYESYQVTPRQHADLLLEMIESTLASAGLSLDELDGLAFGRGPGAFTGVRIAAGVIQGLAFGAELSVAPISTLAALAQGAYRLEGQRRVAAAFDARMDEVYWGLYELGEDATMALVDTELVIAPGEIPLPPGSGWCAAGSGWQRYQAVLSNGCRDALNARAEIEHPHAQDVATLAVAVFAAGQQVDAANALPVYLRDRVTR